MRHGRRLGRTPGNPVRNQFDVSRCCPQRSLQTHAPGLPSALHRLGGTQRHDGAQRQVEGAAPGGVRISESVTRQPTDR
ncbi:MAG: hypothetical protein QOE71_429 [Pseudonocardiales bacterium]|jgi:hypothetical protein|nr:hypothetical protein [Pseudonocardiales bacterium]